MSSDSSDSEISILSPSSTRKSKTTHRLQKFRTAWLTIPEYKAWLRRVENNLYKGQCILCKKEVIAELSSIKKHSKSAKHIKNSRLKQTSSSSSSLMDAFVKTASSSFSAAALVTEAEIKLSGFLAEHNMSFLTLNHLCPLLSNVFPDSKIAKQLSIRRTKSRAIVTNVIAESYKQDLTIALQNTSFSILTDESTDISATKTICIVVRYFEKNKKIQTSLWELVSLYQEPHSQGTAEHLYNLIINSFISRNIPIGNIIGFASDGCNLMMGAHNSVSSRFKESCPGIIIMKCVCHSLHLCSSQACKSLPRTCEDLARNIYNIFKSSSKRLYDFKQFQEFVEVDVHKILHPSQTRWLSLTAVVARIWEQWAALQLYFNEKFLAERLLSAEQIHNGLNDPFIKLYYLFLAFVLPKITKINQYFQSEKVLIINLHDAMSNMYKEILLCFLQRRYVMEREIHLVDPENKSFYLPKNTIYFGVDIYNGINKPEIQQCPDLLNHFYERCIEFYCILCKEIRKRYDFNDELLPLLHIFKPENAISSRTRDRFPTLASILSKLPRLYTAGNEQLIDDQWRLLPNYVFNPNEINIQGDIDVFWTKLYQVKHEENLSVFENLSSFVLNILAFPHSNASCERVFSKVNNIKTKSRNRLITKTINGCLLTKECVAQQGNCIKFAPNVDMLSRMTASNLYSNEDLPAPSSTGIAVVNIADDHEFVIE